MKKLLSLTGIIMLTAAAAFAGDGKTFKDKVVVEPPACKFRDMEFQVDASATSFWYRQGRPAWGGGLGMNFFFAKYFGVGVEQDIIGRAGNAAQWATIGNFFLRYPICSWNLAPYAMVGGGGSYGGNRTGVGFGHVGGGVEYRITNNIGVFTDARYMYTSRFPENGVIGRVGMRFAF